MKKFYFRLQKILDLRKKLEAAQHLKLSAAAAAYQALIHRQEVFFLRAEEERASAHNMDIKTLTRADLFYRQAEQIKAALQPEVDEARRKMEQEQALYNKLHRETQALAVLRKKHLEEYRKAELHAENIEIDEMSKRPRS